MRCLRASLLLVVPLLLTTDAFAQRPLSQALADPAVTAALAHVDTQRDVTARWRSWTCSATATASPTAPSPSTGGR